jgi:hypothetical protein
LRQAAILDRGLEWFGDSYLRAFAEIGLKLLHSDLGDRAKALCCVTRALAVGGTKARAALQAEWRETDIYQYRIQPKETSDPSVGSPTEGLPLVDRLMHETIMAGLEEDGGLPKA